MSYDYLTASAIIIVIVLIVVIILLGRNNAMIDMRLRKLARNLSLLQTNEEARKLCKEIHEKYPDLCAGMDFTLKEDGGSVKIDEWSSNKPQP